jgi:MoxR-like ATPase
MKVNIKQASDMVKLVLKANLVPIIHGSPAIGKSDVVKSIADKYKLKLIDIRLSQCDVTDLNGLISFKGNKCSYSPMDIFPLEDDPIPEGYNGFLLFFNIGDLQKKFCI